MKNNLIYKDNRLITATYALTLSEQRLILGCISKIKSDESMLRKSNGKNISLSKNYEEYELSVNEYSETFGLSRKEAYNELLRISDKLYHRDLKIKNKNGSITKTRWISSITYNPDDAVISIEFAPKIVPYLTLLEREFTKYRLEHVSNMTSLYAIRLYELLAKHQFQEIKEINISVSDLKTMLLVENKYKLFGHFHDRVIKPAVEQINKHSNFIADYELIKKSRSFSDIKIKFKLKKPLKKISDKAEIITITNEIIDKNARPGETKYVVATRLVASGKYKHAQRKTKE